LITKDGDDESTKCLALLNSLFAHINKNKNKKGILIMMMTMMPFLLLLKRRKPKNDARAITINTSFSVNKKTPFQ